MEKKYKFISAATVALCLWAGTALANETSNPRLFVKQQTDQKVTKRNIATSTPYQASPLKVAAAQTKGVAKAQGVVETVLVNEDFSAFSSGTADKPDTTQMLACDYAGYSPNGIFIDNSLTKDGTWFGSFVYPAGGTVALKTYNPQVMAYLCTPLGDYSGDLTVSLRVKANPAVVKTEDGYVTLTGSGLNIQVSHGGYEDQEESKTDDEDGFFSVRLYEKEGWQEVTYTCKNFSSNNDGYICFSTEGSVVIDDVKVKVGNSFIAAPVIKGITDFKKDQFSIAWEPTRKAFNYYVDLYKRHYFSENDTTFMTDFDEGIIEDGWETSSQTFSDTEGDDNTKGLVLKNGDYFITPTTGNDYKQLHFYMKTIDTSVDPSDPYAQWYVGGNVYIDLKNDDGWKNIGQYYAMGFWKSASTVKLEEELSSFKKNGYNQFRLRVDGLNDGAYIVIDDVDITAKPAYEYEIIGAEYSQDLNDNYAFTTSTKKTSCTFSDLDPNTEYYYGVRAHYVSQFSDRQFIHALGVAAPEAKAATDVDSRGSFTANWDAAPKATSYTVNCYGVTALDKDVADYPVLEEDFSLVDANVTTATGKADAEPLGNADLSSLDAYTQLPGWTGHDNTLAQGMLGIEGDGSYTGGTIYTPVLDLSHADECKLTLKIYGNANDQIAVRMNGKSYYLTLSEDGVADGTYSVPVTEPKQSIRLYSQTYSPMVLDYIKVTQDLHKGDTIKTWLATADTDATTTSYAFTGLDAYSFALYGFDVTSHFLYDGITDVTSIRPSETKYVDLLNNTAGMAERISGEDAKVVARYNASGQLISAPVKGINILKLANGKVMKVIVK